MKLIPLEEIRKYLITWSCDEVIHWIDYLPTIDPITIIDEMIEEEAKKDDQHLDETKYLHAWRILRELKSRLLLTE